MSWGRIIDNVKYICLNNDLNNDNNFKKKSLEDNVYFTLRDIFLNADCFDTISEASNFNYELTNGISFEERDSTFQYTNKLNDKIYLKRLIKWLNYIRPGWFEFVAPGEDYEDEVIDMNDYMKFDDWYIQFEELRGLISKQYNKVCKWEKDDVERDMDKLGDLLN